ncbi:hypothetical protein [Deinococcus pimensis]|uniref:hypothetical protein n=1 Tax=Deinococcus pimensis TaxID=309888 RepID=UPI0004876D66|nr:hypothetical protein [Deinococcus pimensis]
MVLLSLDWDAWSASTEHVFDSPLWGSRDTEADRVDRWRERARKRALRADGWDVLQSDFPLLGDPLALLAYRGVPTTVTWTHADAWTWLGDVDGDGEDVVNVDSHHDLYSLSGDPARVRPGNWAGLALARGRVRNYTCVYPAWHEGVRVAEGFDLDRTREELRAALAPDVLERVTLTRGEPLPDPARVKAVLLVQSPSWTSPAHDDLFTRVARELGARELSPALRRPWTP